MTDSEQSVDRTIARGEYVAVTAKQGWLGAAGVVVGVSEEGFDLLPLPSSADLPLSADHVVWRGVAHIERQSPPETLVRVYRGRQQADTAGRFQRDSEALGSAGYKPTTQSWAQGQWGCGAFLVALLLCIVLVGILVFIYLLVVKPEGTLTVTYAKAAPASSLEPAPLAQEPSVPASTPLTLTQRLGQLDEARTAGLVTAEEYEVKRAALLGDL